MKSIDELTNTDKAKLIHQLFPEEIAPFLEYTLSFCENLIENKTAYESGWSSKSIITFSFWLHLAHETKSLIKRLRYDMIKSRHVFAEQLCFNHNAIFFNECLVRYAKEKATNEKFKMAVDLLYLTI
ncbi:hypothetical protein H8S90_23980 [Olivibacter sp. SDN3]|uniref:hypothetical protein n=1 Tax=Olivibacter sp. SDN3 TaxID=2764720 RepID=UPI0016518237|nr:hypothetical protein [Olivibacter sp. SDN3]QNL49732.1 hypothetical protein H8S90_23980 [Olivibacter sp. SDN3]